MVNSEHDAFMPSHRINIRVAYHETDGQRHVHHVNYANYFERGRVEMLRAMGWNYKAMEDSGRLLVVSELSINYFAPAEFDDELVLETRVLSARGARICHEYRITRADTVIVTGLSTIACVDREGRARRLPPELVAVARPTGQIGDRQLGENDAAG